MSENKAEKTDHSLHLESEGLKVSIRGWGLALAALTAVLVAVLLGTNAL